MTITDIRVRRLTQDGKLRAIVSITFDDALAVHDIKVIEGRQGLFVSMPSRRSSTGEYRDIIHPINQQGRQMIEEKILQAYHNSVLAHSGMEATSLFPPHQKNANVRVEKSDLQDNSAKASLV